MKMSGDSPVTRLGERLLLDIRVPAVLLSFLVSAWIAYNTDVVNGDAVLYLSAAYLVDVGGWNDACQLSAMNCWLLYPALIALVGKFTGLGMENSAYVLNALFSGLMVFSFLSLVRLLGADRRTLLFAAFVILFHPYLNENKADIIRDHGYWALYLVTLFFFIHYWQRLDWKNALAWGLSAIAATLFRIEGLVLLFFLPMALIFYPVDKYRYRIIYLLKSYIVHALLIAGVFGWWLFDPGFSTDKAGRLFEPAERIAIVWEQITTGLGIKANIISEQVLGKYLDDYALIGLYITLIVIVVTKIVVTLSPLYALLALFRKLYKRLNPPAGVFAVLIWLIILNLIILIVEILSVFILSGRFVVPLALTIMLMMPFALAAIYELWLKCKILPCRVRWIFPAIFATIIFMIVDGIYSTNKGDKAFLKEAGVWLRGRMSEGESVYAEDRRLFYYSGQAEERKEFPKRGDIVGFLDNGRWRSFDYIAINVERDDALLKKARDIMGKEIRKFTNEKHPGVFIFSNRKQDSVPLSTSIHTP